MDPKYSLTVGFYDNIAEGRSKYLNFHLAKYTIDGKFLGFDEMTSELSQCPFTF